MRIDICLVSKIIHEGNQACRHGIQRKWDFYLLGRKVTLEVNISTDLGYHLPRLLIIDRILIHITYYQ